MTEEEKSLLLEDLCARLLYGVKVKINGVMSNPLGCEVIGALVKAEAVYVHLIPTEIPIEEIKPYLRPMSNMTKKEINEFHKLKFRHINYGSEPLQCVLSIDEIDWLNQHHFDYRDLIGKELALVAPENMYKL